MKFKEYPHFCSTGGETRTGMTKRGSYEALLSSSPGCDGTSPQAARSLKVDNARMNIGELPEAPIAFNYQFGHTR